MLQDKKRLLFLVHRIPYPPNKGDKIRSFNMLKYFAQRYQVYLGAFIDDPNDKKYLDDVKGYCEDVCLLGLNPLLRRLASLKGLLKGQPLTFPYYALPEMQLWVDKVMRANKIDAIVVFSSPMAQFVENHGQSGVKRVVDFVDVDSDKWRQYTQYKSWPLSWVYAREARTLLAYERRITAAFDATVLVSEDEASLFKQLAPEMANKVFAINNGVDTNYFSPEHDYPNPYSTAGKVLVFTGAMDYWANVDAVRWFAEHVFPGVREKVADAEFYIVGARPTSDVLALDKIPGITVTGAVKDIRPYIAHARAAVTPMRIARGVQNKVLEAMAMAKPVLATPEAAAGIIAQYNTDLLVTAGEDELTEAAIKVLKDGGDVMGNAARNCVLQQYGWSKNLSRFDELLSGESTVKHGSIYQAAEVLQR